jgi:hypothetical protein
MVAGNLVCLKAVNIQLPLNFSIACHRVFHYADMKIKINLIPCI